ncbi:hypothetical protein BCR39DRAFT_521080 [Naematelia encephala]|uniref:UAS domain-containing protein n=1 Tax=Naematelia encephala TaxID=71784 RepID=A0A1Y2BE24_9TREE|nr:hypothetical protein BCR39DRAFT_521080 [Naematelia encephala]
MSRTTEQMAALEQLWAVTASETTASRDRDERLLRENGWDVQSTIEQIFTMNERPPITSGGPSRPAQMEVEDDSDTFAPRPPSGSRRLSGSRPRHRPGPVGTGLGVLGILYWPVSLLWSVVGGGWYFLIRTFMPLSFLPYLPPFLRPPSLAASSPRISSSRDPLTQSLDFIHDISSFTGCSPADGTLPDFYEGGYRDFLTHVRKEGKVGLVLLVCGEHEDDEEFKRDVLCDREFVRCLKDKEILIWGADIRSREGYQVSQTLLTTTYPALTFVTLVAGVNNSVSSPKLSILTTISGPPSTTTSAASLIQTITTSVLPRATPFLTRLRRERSTLAEARHLREEQDRAFRDAERRDRERMEARKKEEELERIRSERAEREERDRITKIEKRRIWRKYARKNLLSPSSSSSSGTIRVALRTPFNNQRNIRHFKPCSSTRELFIYAETLLIPDSEDPSNDPDTPPEDYEPEFDFRIVTSYPRKEVELVDDDGEIMWDLVKGAGGALFAEKLDNGNWGADQQAQDESDEEIVE